MPYEAMLLPVAALLPWGGGGALAAAAAVKSAIFVLTLRERAVMGVVAIMLATIASTSALLLLIFLSSFLGCGVAPGLAPAPCMGAAIAVLWRRVDGEVSAEHRFLDEPLRLSVRCGVLMLLAGFANAWAGTVLGGVGPRFFAFWTLKVLVMLLAVGPCLLLTVLIEYFVAALLLHPVDHGRLFRPVAAANGGVTILACLAGGVANFQEQLQFSRYLSPPW